MIPGRGPNHPTFRRSFLFAVQGFRTAVAQERNIKVILATGAVTILVGLIVGLDAPSWAILLLCCGCVIAAELFNTAIEKVVDLVSPEFHPLAGQAKDIAAAAVWILCVLVAVVGILLFGRALFFA
ncbi:MAG: diacylglycerol kinase family protein [Atopobiaceae bacterium]|nr:diacylglycerol kinase family protein [Atopobiaceae bacterium]MBR1829421.1 diacylglycerol kinase family protein [Atopobiaceae bacterium]